MKHQIIAKADSSEAKLYLDLPHFRNPKYLGSIFRASKTLRTIPRNYGNLFHMFGKPGLGVNSEILTRFNFDYIEIPYNNDILRTTRKHFIEHSIHSPFQNNRVDSQRVLPVDDFIIPEEKPEQLSFLG